MDDDEEVPLIINWVGSEGISLIQKLTVSNKCIE